MNGNERNLLLQSISKTIVDYRVGEINQITLEHVEKWVCQFEKEEQTPILKEMDLILKKWYISRLKAKFILARALTSQKIFGSFPYEVIPKIKFLSIQRKGESQKSLLELANEVIEAIYEINIENCGKFPIGYIYLDDCLFSGNTVYYDLKPWLPSAIEETTLYLIFLTVYTNGLRYFQKKFNPEAYARNIFLDYRPCYKLNNIAQDTEKFEGLWPSQVIDDELIDKYINQVRQRCQDKNFSPRLFRPEGVPQNETLFSSSQARNIVEKAFLKAGAYIISLPQEPKNEMRPMGYEKLESLGFGAFVITYRNIANNCPLALWWGDPNYPSNHPFSKWYPLFPRKVNEQ